MLNPKLGVDYELGEDLPAVRPWVFDITYVCKLCPPLKVSLPWPKLDLHFMKAYASFAVCGAEANLRISATRFWTLSLSVTTTTPTPDRPARTRLGLVALLIAIAKIRHRRASTHAP